MASQPQSSPSKSIAWIALFAVNLVLGILFWFRLSTDYKLKNLWAEVGFTWLVGIVAFISWILLSASALSRSWKILFSYCVAPSVIGSIPHLFLSIIAVFVSLVFVPILVDQIEAPDHSKALEVYYLPDIDCGHSYLVSLRYYAFPFIRRDIAQLLYLPNDVPLCSYETGKMKGSIDTGIDWISNDEINVPYGNSGLKAIYVGLVRFHWPKTHISFFVGYIGLLTIIHGIQRSRDRQKHEDT